LDKDITPEIIEIAEKIQGGPVLSELFERLLKYPNVAKLFLTQMQDFDPEKEH
jgi:hypothetical protein